LVATLLVAFIFSALPHRPVRAAQAAHFTNFETIAIRPLALSRNARYLYALNTPDDRLEVFEIKAGRLNSVGETTPGQRPVIPLSLVSVRP